MVSYWENHFGCCPSGAGERKRACSLPGWGGLVFLNCSSAEQLLYQYSDLRGCQQRVKNRKRWGKLLGTSPSTETQEHVLFSAPLANNGQHDSPHLRTLASWSSFSLSFSIKLVEPAPQPLHQILLLAWCHLIPRLSVGERVVPSAGKDPTSLMLQCKRLHGEEQVVSCPISALRGLFTVVLFKTWQLGIACDERSFAV